MSWRKKYLRKPTLCNPKCGIVWAYVGKGWWLRYWPEVSEPRFVNDEEMDMDCFATLKKRAKCQK